MARRLLICLIVLVTTGISIQILEARNINHERFIQRWFKWRVPVLGLEVERWKAVRHNPVKRDAPDTPPLSNESQSEGESHEDGIDDLSRLPAMSKESEENGPPGIARVPLEKSVAPPIFPPQVGANRFLEQPERLLTNIGLSESMNEYIKSVGGVLPVIPKVPEPKIFSEAPLKMLLPLVGHEIKPLPPPPPPPLFVPGNFILEEPKIKEPPFFEPVIKEPEKVEIVHVIEHEPPIIEIPPPPPHPEVVEIKPILVEIPPEPQPIPAPPLPPIFKPEVKPPEVVEITHVVEEVKPPPPPVPGPIAIGTKWMFLFSDMLLHALSEIITGARAGFAQFTTATEQ